MTEEEAIKHALENWQDENYIAGNFLYVINESLGHYKYEINQLQIDWIVVKFSLIKIGKGSFAKTYYSKNWVLSQAEIMKKRKMQLYNELLEIGRMENIYFESFLAHFQKP